MAIKKYQISNTGYTGQQVSSLGEYSISYTGTNNRTEYYTTSDSTDTITTDTGTRTTGSTFTTKATMTSTTASAYSSSSSDYTSSSIESTSNWYTTSAVETTSQTDTADTDTVTTTTPSAEYSTSSTYTTEDWYSTSTSWVSTSENTITGTVHDYSFTTKLNRNEYVSITWNRTQGNQYYQNNNYYTDGYTYMLTNDFGGISITNSITTGTSGTYTRTSAYDWMHFAYVWDWWWSTTTLWNETTSTSDWSQTYTQEYTTNWSWTDWHWEGGWTTTSYSKVSYYTTTTLSWMYTDSWTTTMDTLTRSSGYQVTTQGNNSVTAFVSLTDTINKVTATYINNIYKTDKTVQVSLFGTSTLIQRFSLPFNGMSSHSTIINMGLNTVTSTSTSTTFEYY